MLYAACEPSGICPLLEDGFGLPPFNAPVLVREGLRPAKVYESDPGRLIFFNDLAWAFDPVAYLIPPFADVRRIGRFRTSGPCLFTDSARRKADWNCGRTQSTMSAAG